MIERRFIEDVELIEARAEKDEATGKRYVMGYFALKNSNSRKLTERINGQVRTFTERILPDAFDNSDYSDVLYTVEHDPTRVIGRTGANLQLTITDKGLFGKAEIPDDSSANSHQIDLMRNIAQKIVRGNSFAFRVEQDSWYQNSTGELFRDIHRIGKIVDVTSTISPAYEDTFVFTRSLNEADIKTIEDETKVETSESTQPETFDKETVDLNFEMEVLKQNSVI